ncbi:hypothetical protein OLMES_5027 [Oleiphilus messinensis]|uniref:Uncharacterized protein n=1 Tax=Oleiphilus messinensis TaxID=141451 RepID=A0A1Y0IHZ5_9GAMM|nr:hypothetical protein [Oleiphilus messinensis]ARU59014.1 hypothetical protein OLMES_5027 [Oleiphilus messinensis]
MTQVYLCQQGEPLSEIYRNLYQPIDKFQHFIDQYIADIQALNPAISQRANNQAQAGDMIILPQKNQQPSIHAARLATELSPDAKLTLSQVSRSIGGDMTMALAVVIDKIRKYKADMNTFGGAALGTAASRADDFLKALNIYDKAISEFEQLRNHRAAPQTLKRARANIDEAYKLLQFKFKRELEQVLKTYTSSTKSTSLIPISQRGRTVFYSVPVNSAPTSQSLARLGKFGKVLGPGFIALDAYFRYETVMNEYRSGGNWQRELFAQGMGFTSGVILGMMSLSLLLGPFGLVLGIFIAGSLAIVVDRIVVGTSKQLYNVAF